MFTKKEQIEILTTLGYTIDKDGKGLSRKAKIYGGSSVYVMIDGKKIEVEEVFKTEIKKRLFNL